MYLSEQQQQQSPQQAQQIHPVSGQAVSNVITISNSGISGRLVHHSQVPISVTQLQRRSLLLQVLTYLYFFFFILNIRVFNIFVN